MLCASRLNRTGSVVVFIVFTGYSMRTRRPVPRDCLPRIHHVAPYAAGGEATADNIQLRCRAHNQYEARLFFGDTLVRELREVWAEHSPSEMTACVLVEFQ